MAWECACGISNHDEAFRCAGCGWSREQGKPDEFDGESQQPGEHIDKGPYKKWGVGEIIWWCFIFPTLLDGIVEKDVSPYVRIFLILLVILILIRLYQHAGPHEA